MCEIKQTNKSIYQTINKLSNQPTIQSIPAGQVVPGITAVLLLALIVNNTRYWILFILFVVQVLHQRKLSTGVNRKVSAKVDNRVHVGSPKPNARRKKTNTLYL